MECSSRGSIAQKTARRQRASRLSSGSVSASTANRVVMHAICPVREARRFALCAHMVTSLQDLCILKRFEKAGTPPPRSLASNRTPPPFFDEHREGLSLRLSSYCSNHSPLIEKGASLQVSNESKLHACCIRQLVNGGLAVERMRK